MDNIDRRITLSLLYYPSQLSNTQSFKFLGTISYAMPHYSYSPLSLGADSIRLLRLMPNEDKEAPIQCKLHNYALQRSGERAHLYEALSYVWGSTENLKSVLIDGCDLPITINLHNALSRLRDRTFERIIWADSVCIDQKRDQEKECQIQLMAKIYGQADRVIVYLGEAADGSDQALEDIRVAAEDEGVATEDENVVTEVEIVAVKDESTSLSNSERSQEAILKLLMRPWFRRIWVLQEVAAARRVLIMCGSAQIDGYVFCLGFNKLKLSYKAHPDLQSIIRSVTYLIRGAIFRPKYATSPSSGLTLSELIDMYHTREATMDHDKVYALFGMSSDDPNAAGLSPDYAVPWKTLLQQLIEFILPRGVSVETWDKREIAVIKSKSCIIGKVSSVEGDSARYDRQHVEVIFNDARRSLEYERDYGSRWTLQASAKPIQQNDIVCLLHGASKPTIIRLCRDHFAVIVIAVTLRKSVRRKSRYVEGQEPLVATENLSHNFLLVWDWERSPWNLQHRVGCETPIGINALVPEYLKTASDKAARLYDVASALGESGEYEGASKILQEIINGFGGACENPHKLAGIENLALTSMSEEQWEKAEEYLLQVIRINQLVQGLDHQDTLSSIANLVSTYISRHEAQGRSRHWKPELARSLTDRIRDNVQITEEDMIRVVSCFDEKIITVVFYLKRDNIPITKEVVRAAAENWVWGLEVMRLLLDKCGDEVKITEEVVEAAAENCDSGLEVMRLLLDERGDEVKITKEVVKVAAENSSSKVMRLLLNERGDEVKIAREAIKVAAEQE